MVHTNDVLLDNGPRVEFFGHIVTGRADELHPVVVSRVIRLSAAKRRQEPVMDVDDLLGVLRAQMRGHDLHKAREHEHFGFFIF